MHVSKGWRHPDDKDSIRVLKEAQEICDKKISKLLEENGHLKEELAKQKLKIKKLIENAKEKIKLINTIDLIESRRIEEKTRRTNQEFEQFVYITSHDLKAPLQAIDKLSAWIIEDGGDRLEERSKKNLSLIRQRVKRLANVIDGILQYARPRGVDVNPCEVNTKELLQEVIDTLNPSERFVIRLSPDLPNFKTAKILLREVFSNLVSNSIKHHHRDAGVIEIGVRDLEDIYEFFVVDDGPGIEPEYFEKIFKVFQTLQPRDGEGTSGIGLSIVKKIVELEGGEVYLTSTIGEGSKFHFTWPKHPRCK